jgi:uncharacterized metal-binding protein YceD (DUF177 family)
LRGLAPFDIDIYNLSPKRHEYVFESGSAFFQNFEQSLIEEGTFTANVTIDKSETMLQLFFHIKGSIVLVCDRTLENFDYPIDIQQKLILKFGDENAELTDEIEIIPRETQRINVSQYIYEYIGLAIPMKKLHPRCANETYEETEESIVVYRSQPSPEENEAASEEEAIDPRWNILKNLNNN